MDFVTDLPIAHIYQEEGHDALFVIVDMFTKYTYFLPFWKSGTAAQAATMLFNNVICHRGFPKKIVSDRDPRFISEFWKTLWMASGTKISMSTARHAQTDGQTERMNRSIEEMLRHFVCDQKELWAKYLFAVTFAYNTAKHTRTCFSPFFLNHGYHPMSPWDLEYSNDTRETVPSRPEASGEIPDTTNNSPNDPSGTPQTSGSPYLDDLENARQQASSSLTVYRERMAKYYNSRYEDELFQTGDLVLVDIAALPGHSTKLDNKYKGPHPVIEPVGRLAYRLDLPSTWQIHPVISVKYLRRFKAPENGQFPLRDMQAPLSESQKDGPADLKTYEVESIIGRRKITASERNKRYFHDTDQYKYAIRYKGYSADETCWLGEREARRGASQLVNEYDARYPKARPHALGQVPPPVPTSYRLRKR